MPLQHGRTPVPDPTPLYRLRDGVYAPDLLVAAVAEFDLFSVVAADGPLAVAALCSRLGLSPRPADVMVTYLAALGLLERLPGGGVRATRLARAHLAGGPALAETVASLPVSSVLDVGGGSGSYACALADRMPGIRAAVLERPPVDAAARALLAERGYARQVAVLPGDMFGGPLPEGYDLHLYSHVLHDWGEDQVRELLTASLRALPPGGWLVDHDVHVNEDKTGPLPAAEYSVLLMHSTSGKCWSTSELGEMLHGCGFEIHGTAPTAGDRSALIARKP
jgi:SAM-dependent methyltransferase